MTVLYFRLKKGLKTYTRNLKLYIIVIRNISAILTHTNILLLKFFFPDICLLINLNYANNKHKTPVST